MPRSAKAASRACEEFGRGRDRHSERHDQADLAGLPHAALGQMVMQKQGGLTRGRRALERRGADPHDRLAFGEIGKHRTQVLGSGEGVELVAAFGQSGCGLRVVLCPQRHHHYIRLVGTLVGSDNPLPRVDGCDNFLAKTYPGFNDIPVGHAHRFGRLAAEHHLELGIAKEKRSFRSNRVSSMRSAIASDSMRSQFESAESRTQHKHAEFVHGLCPFLFFSNIPKLAHCQGMRSIQLF